MITSTRWSSSFGTVMVSESGLFPCFFEVSLSFTPNTDSHHEQQVALERLEAFFSQMLDSALLISEDHELLDLFECGTDCQVLTLPDQPSTQLLGQALLEKVSVITEGKLLVDFLSISSSETGSAEYILDAADTDAVLAGATTDLDTPAWWLRNDLTISDYVHELESGERIILGTDLSWEQLHLGWHPEMNVPETGAEVLPFRPHLVDVKPKNETQH